MAIPTTTSFTAPRMEPEDALIEFKTLSKDRQQDAICDVYGTRLALPETPDLIKNSLRALRQILQDSPPTSSNQHYRNALERCPDYVTNDNFLLLFLRADYFHETNAAARLHAYWKEKVKLFGESIAYKKLQASDLTEADLEPCRTQGLYFLPSLDGAGRAVLVTVKSKWSYGNNWKNMARWVWYNMEAALEDVSVQRHGAVGLGCDDGPFSISQFDRKLESWLMKVAKNQFLPIRFVAIHHMYDSKVYDIIIPFLLGMMSTELRARYRIYPGSRGMDRIAALEEMALSKDMLPTFVGGALDYDANIWLEQRLTDGK